MRKLRNSPLCPYPFVTLSEAKGLTAQAGILPFEAQGRRFAQNDSKPESLSFVTLSKATGLTASGNGWGVCCRQGIAST